ncbi:MAG TPA: ABC transporter permease [Stackebrandtia sp.]|nr:ABC transporter permease [Stackebrandtia sp.]HZE39555.1 ABC transporter permease [Stackebrandtia sp.]
MTLSTAGRILRQLVHDRRTIALVVAVPALLLVLLRYVMDSQPHIFQSVGLSMLGVFPFISMFLVTSVAMLRERTSGTLERALTTPVHKFDLICGYALAFTLAAVVQSVIASAVAYWWLDLDTDGPAWLVIVIAAANAVLGLALGLFASAFANTEFQAVQFMPAIVLPQVLLCGLIWPRDQMADWLEKISDVLPLTYAVDALGEVGSHSDATRTLWWDLAIVAGCAVAALILGAATLRRRTA